MISFSLSGSTTKTQAFLGAMESNNLYSALDGIAQRGVIALAQNTAKDSGFTAQQWDYEISIEKERVTITWLNHHVEDGVNVAIILQYGHGTGTGGYVSGRDYINPAIKPIFDEIANEVWKKVTNS